MAYEGDRGKIFAFAFTEVSIKYWEYAAKQKDCTSLKKNLNTMKRNILLTSLFSLCSFFVFSQNHTSKGKEFWLAYMENLTLAFNGPPYFSIVVSSETNTQGVIQVPATGYTQSFSVNAMQATEVYLPQAIYYPQGDEDISNTGIKITTDDSVNIYAYHYRAFFSEATLLVPESELTSSYLIISQRDDQTPSVTPSEFVVMATTDSTTISITPSVFTLSARPAGVPFTITLNTGQTFLLQSLDELTGSTVVCTDSTKKIAVFGGAREANIHCTSGGANSHVYDMIYNASLGTKFIVVPGYDLGGDMIKIISQWDSNYVNIDNGNSIFMAHKGDYIDTFISSASYVVSEKQIAIAQFTENRDCNTSLTGDPNMVLLTPADRMKYSANFKSIEGHPQSLTIYNPNHFVNIVVDALHMNDVYLDSVQLTGFSNINANPAYAYLALPISIGMHRLTCAYGFNAWAYDLGDYNATTFHLGFDFLNTVVSDIEIQQESAKTVYPNPFSDYLDFNFRNQRDDMLLFIYDSNGRLMFSKELRDHLTIDTKRFSSGIYFYIVSAKNIILQRGKLTKL